MKRRNFLAASALTVGAFIQSSTPALSRPLSTHKQQLTDFLENIGAVPLFISFLNDPELLTIYQKKSKSLTDMGYRLHDAKLYFCDEDQVAIFPLALKNDSLGIMDLSTLFLRKNVTGKWQYCNTMSSFHFDAIAQVVSQFKTKPDQKSLTELFVPVLAKSENPIPGTILTAKGAMNLKVLIGDQKTTLEFSLEQNRKTLFAQNLISRHTLSCATLA
jgi:hypothetical protein